MHAVPVVGAVPVLEADWVRADRWEPVVRGGFVFADKIHVKEERTEVLGLRRASRNVRNHGRVLLSITDSLPAALSFEKGRSKDWGLAVQVRLVAAYVLACRFVWRQRYCMSEHNPTDFGSRLVERGLLPRGSVIAGDRWKTAVALGEADAAPVSPPPAAHPMLRGHLLARRPTLPPRRRGARAEGQQQKGRQGQ